MSPLSELLEKSVNLKVNREVGHRLLLGKVGHRLLLREADRCLLLGKVGHHLRLREVAPYPQLNEVGHPPLNCVEVGLPSCQVSR